MAECRARLQAESPVVERAFSAFPPSPRSLESLWVRLKVGGRIRPRDALMLRRLALPPFDGGLVYELSAQGYVNAVGVPGNLQVVDHSRLLSAFERHFGVPEGFANVLSFHVS